MVIENSQLVAAALALIETDVVRAPNSRQLKDLFYNADRKG